MTTLVSQKRPSVKKYLFGIFTVQLDRERQTQKLKLDPLRLLTVGGIVFVLLYSCAVAAGYTWLKKYRKLDQISVIDVALMRWREVRRTMAAQQFDQARHEVKAEKFQAAFVTFSTAMRNDPDNIPGRLAAVEFFVSVGSTNQAINLLKDGIQRFPENAQLLEKTFDLLTSVARDKEALDLLHSPLAVQATGTRAAILHTYEIQATLNTAGPIAARAMLERYPEVRRRAASGQTVARVLWDSKERLAAIEPLKAYVAERPQDYVGYSLLAQYQEAAGMNADAQETAARASAAIPNEIGPRILRIGTLSPLIPLEFPRWQSAVEAYLKDFREKPQAIELLANIAGRKGWVDFSRTLYQVGMTRRQESHVLALYYIDSLSAARRVKEAILLLTDLEAQTPDESPFSVLVRQRKIALASLNGDRDAARDDARRLANALRQDADRLELCRRYLVQFGAAEAAEEMASTLAAVRSAPKK